MAGMLAQGTTVAVGNVYEQAIFILQTIETALAEVGAKMSDVVRTRMFVTDISGWEEIGRAHGQFFAGINPAATMVEVKRLVNPDRNRSGCGGVRRMTQCESIIMEKIRDLERQLAIANQRLQKARTALAPKHKGGEWEEYFAANREVLSLERRLASAKGEEYAEPCDFPLKWDTGAPMPHLMVNDHRALLAFLISEPDPNWDGSYVTIKSPADEQPEPLGLVEFDFCISARLGAPNDEVFEGHPLNGKGLEAYRAQRVINSRWLKEIEKINSVHRMYRPESWRDLTHFIFWFHDSTFECIARSFTVETHRVSMRDLLSKMVVRLIS